MTIPDPLPAAGFAVPLRASFAVVRALPLLALAHNSLAPRLVLHDDHAACRVLVLRKKRYADLDEVDAQQGLGMRSVVLAERGRALAFSASVRNADGLVDLLRFFARKHVRLSARAEALLAGADA